MAFCSNCGAKLEYGAKFCPFCGSKATVHNKTQEEKAENGSARTSEYAGTLIKCPACGTELPSLTAICPACGHEINSAKVSDSLAKFISQINDCDRRIANSNEKPKKGWSSWETWKKIGWVILNIYFACIPLLLYFLFLRSGSNKSLSLTAEEKYKATLIENYVFPNDRGSILEALLFIKSKIGFIADEKINANNLYWMRLWGEKAKQLHQKAEMLFPEDKIANDTYKQILSDGRRIRKKIQIRIGVTVGVIVIVVIFIAIHSIGSGTGGSGVNSSKSELLETQGMVTNEAEINNTSKLDGENIELTIKYKVMSNGKAEITGYSGIGNHATIDSKIDGYEVARIADGAFEGCGTLESILFWANIEEIGDSAFKNCTALVEISIPNETKNIGAHAFEGCTELSSLVIWGNPDIGEYAFAGCMALTEVSIGYNTKNVGAHAFDGCISLTTATIWNADTIIGKDAFANCPNLEGRPIQE